MNKEEIVKLINKYQGMLDSSVFPLLNKCKVLKEKYTDDDSTNKFDSIISDIKSNESVIIKFLNRYVSDIEKTS